MKQLPSLCLAEYRYWLASSTPLDDEVCTLSSDLCHDLLYVASVVVAVSDPFGQPSWSIFCNIHVLFHQSMPSKFILVYVCWSV